MNTELGIQRSRPDRIAAFATSLAASLLAACTVQGVQSNQTKPAAETVTCSAGAPAGQRASCWIQITPISTVRTGFGDPNQNFSNAYTRLLINSRHTRETDGAGRSDEGGEQDSGEALEQYDYLDRGWFKRLFWGTQYTINLTAYISVGSFEATVPLMTIDHASNRSDGEKFSRLVVHTAQKFPLFLVKGDGSNSIANVRFVVKASDQTDSRAAAAAIQTAEAVAKVLAPEASVLTTLNAQRTRDKADALDRAINAVLAKQLNEEQWFENDVRRWGKGVRITLRIPGPQSEKDWGDSSQFVPVGAWNVVFEHPRPSIFADDEICVSQAGAGEPQRSCHADFATAARTAQTVTAARPQQVLAFNLTASNQPAGTIGSYLRQQEWWQESFKTFAAPDKAAPNAADVSNFCQSIKQTVVGLGLNAVDAGIVAVSVRQAAQVPAAVAAQMQKESSCAYAVP
jgi:hypothetical protein